MKILNIIFNNAKGGVEQAFIDYTEIMQKFGHEVFCVIQKNSQFAPDLEKVSKNTIYTRFLRLNIFRWLLYFEIKNIIKLTKPDIIIYHNERNIDIIQQAAGKTPILAVNHGCKTKKMINANYIFAVNSKIAKSLIKQGFNKDRITIIGNMTKI